MIEKTTPMAASVATQVSESRRRFLGRLGEAALGTAAFLAAGLFAVSNKAQAAPKLGTLWRCTYVCDKTTTIVDEQCGFGCKKRIRNSCILTSLEDSGVKC